MVCMQTTSHANEHEFFGPFFPPETHWIPLVATKQHVFFSRSQLHRRGVLHNFYQSSKSLTHYLLPLTTVWQQFPTLKWMNCVHEPWYTSSSCFVYMSVCHTSKKEGSISKHRHVATVKLGFCLRNGKVWWVQPQQCPFVYMVRLTYCQFVILFSEKLHSNALVPIENSTGND